MLTNRDDYCFATGYLDLTGKKAIQYGKVFYLGGPATKPTNPMTGNDADIMGTEHPLECRKKLRLFVKHGVKATGTGTFTVKVLTGKTETEAKSASAKVLMATQSFDVTKLENGEEIVDSTIDAKCLPYVCVAVEPAAANAITANGTVFAQLTFLE